MGNSDKVARQLEKQRKRLAALEKDHVSAMQALHEAIHSGDDPESFRQAEKNALEALEDQRDIVTRLEAALQKAQDAEALEARRVVVKGYSKSVPKFLDELETLEAERRALIEKYRTLAGKIGDIPADVKGRDHAVQAADAVKTLIFREFRGETAETTAAGNFSTAYEDARKHITGVGSTLSKINQE